MENKYFRFATIAALGVGSLYVLKKYYDKKSQKEEEEPKEDESAKEETKTSPRLVDDDITMESIVEEDPLYNQFTYTQLRAIFYEFYRRAHVWTKDGVSMKVLSMDDFISIFQLIDVDDVDICKTMFSVWDHDKDGYVGIRDFIHTFAYAQRGTDNERMDYIFRTADLTCDNLLTFEDVRRNMVFLLKNDSNVDPESVERQAIDVTRDVFEKLKANPSRGITYNSFLSSGRFLNKDISLLRLFALALLKGDEPLEQHEDWSVCY